MTIGQAITFAIVCGFSVPAIPTLASDFIRIRYYLLGSYPVYMEEEKPPQMLKIYKSKIFFQNCANN